MFFQSIKKGEEKMFKKKILLLICVAFLLVLSWSLLAHGENLYKGETIHVVTFKLSGMDEIINRIPEFEEKYDINVKLDEISMEAMRSKMRIDFSAGTKQIDVALSSVHITPTLIASNDIEPIDRFLESDLVEPELLAWDDFTPAAIDNITSPVKISSKEEKVWGLPHDLLVQGLIYRKSLYEKYNLSVPKTLSELLHNAKIINENESVKGMYGISLRSLRSPQIIWSWGQIFRAMGGKYFEDFPNDLHPTMDTEVTVEALKFFKECFKYSPPGSENQAYTEVVSQLSSGQAAQTLDDIMFSLWLEDPKKSVAPEDWGYALIPLKEGLTYDDIKYGPSVSMSNHWVINADISEARKQAAFKFIQWATSKPLLKDLSEKGYMTGVLTRKSMYELNKDKAWAIAHMQNQKHSSKYFRPKLPEWVQLEDELALRVSSVLIGDLSAEEAAKQLQDVFTQIVKDAGYID